MTHHALEPVVSDVRGSVSALFDKVPVDADEKRRLWHLMSGSDRIYHGLDHLALLWERHRRYGGPAGMHDPTVDQMIACTIAYHDAIYDARRTDNEIRSAELWLEASTDSLLPNDIRKWVAETIVATRDHLAYEPLTPQVYEAQPLFERARLWFLDLDLSPIGECPADFAANTDRLRAENSHRPEADYERDRLRFLARLASHERLFRSPVLAAVFEATARHNLAHELS